MNNAAWTTFNNRVPYLKGTPVPKEPEVVNRPRCGATMELIVRIEPFGKDPGVRAYECRACHGVTSEFDEPRPREPVSTKSDEFH